MFESTGLAPMPDAVWQSRTRWGLQIGGMHVALTRTRERRSIGALTVVAPAARRPAWPMAIGAFTAVSALTLLVMAAAAAPRPAEPGPRYIVSVAIPGPALPATAHLAGHAAVRRHRPSRAAAPVESPVATADEPFGRADAPSVARAMATGAFQKWEDAAGQRRFLTASAAAARNGRYCRSLALLVRSADGSSRVSSAERCVTGPVSEEWQTPMVAAGDGD